jgi:hypothetical protein
MDRALTEKHHGIFETCSNFFQFAIKGFAVIAGGIGGCIIIAALFFPLFLVFGFLLKAIGF